MWESVLIPFALIMAGGIGTFWTLQVLQNRHWCDYRRRSYFQDRYAYSFDTFVARNQVDRTGLAEILQRSGPRNEKATIRFIQQFEDVPTHVARRYARYLMGKEQ